MYYFHVLESTYCSFVQIVLYNNITYNLILIFHYNLKRVCRKLFVVCILEIQMFRKQTLKSLKITALEQNIFDI